MWYAERLVSRCTIVVNRKRLASYPRHIQIWWCISSIHLEFDDRRLVKEALLTSNDEQVWEQTMGDHQGKM